jgi:hypothetical protein
MLIIIPTLTVNDPDVSHSLTARLVHNLAVSNATDPSTYESDCEIRATIDISLIQWIDVLCQIRECKYITSI